ncbi:hypothetical protein [Paenibacillus sp. An7]|uniref:hypothetical protein n=1 Tax=Paenibacillus sp. An7 TaxID=2689577 RepID=UPI001356C703|nr:hypothetical protein [Paenibacillus sp. An7]
MNNDKNKYLTIFLIIGFSSGACVSLIVNSFLDLNVGISISLGAGFGMLLGIVIGSLIDYERQNKDK